MKSTGQTVIDMNTRGVQTARLKARAQNSNFAVGDKIVPKTHTLIKVRYQQHRHLMDNPSHPGEVTRHFLDDELEVNFQGTLVRCAEADFDAVLKKPKNKGN